MDNSAVNANVAKNDAHTDAPELTSVAWPVGIVNIPDPHNADARIVGFRIREGDEAWGRYGLSEPLSWLGKACKNSVTRDSAEAVITAKEEDRNRSGKEWRKAFDNMHRRAMEGETRITELESLVAALEGVSAGFCEMACEIAQRKRKESSKHQETLKFQLGQLRHAYTHLKHGRVVNQQEFADGLLSPVIQAFEKFQMKTQAEEEVGGAQ